MPLEQSEPIYDGGELVELRLFFRDSDGDTVRFDIDPGGELWVMMKGKIVKLNDDDVRTLLQKMLDTFANNVTT